MSDTTTKWMLRAYESMASPTRFLSGMFTSPPENFYSSEEVEIDIVRSGEDVAVVVQNLDTGYRMNTADLYTNKSFIAPVYKEAFPVRSSDLIKRQPGMNPFETVDFRANLITQVFRQATKVEQKIRRSIELQASQVLQTGALTLTDENGTALYSLDFQPKATHFPTSGTAWDQAGADPIGDLDSLCNVVREDGLEDPDQLTLGEDAWESFISNDAVQKRFEQRRLELGVLGPSQRVGNGGIYRGVVEVGNYQLDVWSYGGRYKDPQTGASTQYLDPAKAIVRSSRGRMDATYGAIPNIAEILGLGTARILPELPGRLSSSTTGMDMSFAAWMSADGQSLFAGAGSRPLMIPTAIDTYGCLDTGV